MGLIQITAGYLAKHLFQLKCWYYKKKFRDCGKNLSVYGRPRVIHGENIILGNHVNLNDGALLNATSSKIIIGDNVTVSSDAKIIAASYSREEFMMKGQRTHIPGGGISIGSNVWICAGVTILPGIQITGEYVILGAGSVITKNIIQGCSVYAGNPARLISNDSVNN